MMQRLIFFLHASFCHRITRTAEKEKQFFTGPFFPILKSTNKKVQFKCTEQKKIILVKTRVSGVLEL